MIVALKTPQPKNTARNPELYRLAWKPTDKQAWRTISRAVRRPNRYEYGQHKPTAVAPFLCPCARVWHVGMLLDISLFWLGGASRATVQSADGVKAAFLFNFAKFIEWLAKAFPDASAPIALGFVGSSPVTDTLEQAVKGKSVLTVGEGADFLGAGGMIAFLLDSAKVVFARKRSSFWWSSPLLAYGMGKGVIFHSSEKLTHS